VRTSFCQSQPAAPTPQEIEQAYQSKWAAGGLFFIGDRWETRRIKEIRGWKLHFKRLTDLGDEYVLILDYQVIAQKSGVCAGYEITDRIPLKPMPGVKESVVVEPTPPNPCQ
jgi:hypothetical protein